jgi:hypothetical protein
MFASLLSCLWTSVLLIQPGKVFGASSQCTDLPLSQYDALKDLYYSTNGSYWYFAYTQTKWNFPPNQTTDAPCSQGWAGIACTCEVDIKTYQISVMNLYSFGLQGSIPVSIGKMPACDICFSFICYQLTIWIH